jgi:hypothetical protein
VKPRIYRSGGYWFCGTPTDRWEYGARNPILAFELWRFQRRQLVHVATLAA